MPSRAVRPPRLAPTAPTDVLGVTHEEGELDGALTDRPEGRSALPDRGSPDRAEPGDAPGGGPGARSRLGDHAGVSADLYPRSARDGHAAACADRDLHPRVRRAGQTRPDRLPDRVLRDLDGRRRLVVRGVRDPEDRDRGTRGSRPATVGVRAHRSDRHGRAVHARLDAVRRRRPPIPHLPRAAALLLLIGGLAGPLALSTPYQIPLAIAIGWIGLGLSSGSRTRRTAADPTSSTRAEAQA